MSRFAITTKTQKATSRFATKAAASSRGGSRFSLATKQPDVSTDQGLLSVATRAGLGSEAEDILNPRRNLSFLQRLGAGLGAFETGQAVYTGMKQGAGAGVKEYFKGVGKGLASAITGRDYGQTEKKSYKDILQEAGVTNKFAKFGLGFLGDVLLDPTTYFGGAMAKGALKGTKGAANIALKGVGKIAPGVETGLRIAGQGVKDAAGKAFVYGYGTSKGLKEVATETMGKISKAKEGIVRSNIERLGTGTLSKAQQDELVDVLLRGKRTELASRQLSEDIAKSTDWFQPLKKRALSMVETREKNLRSLGREISALNKKGLRISLKTIQDSDLPELVSKVKIKTVPEKVLFGEGDELLERAPGYTKVVGEEFATPAAKDVKSFIESLITLPKKELDKVKKLIGTREGWKKGLLDEITDLNNEFTRLNQLQKETFQLADATRAGGKIKAVEESLQNLDPKLRELFQQQTARSQRFAKQADIADPYSVYFPGIRKDKLQKFLESTKTFRVGSEGYRKEFKNLLKDDELIRNPAEAFARREFEIAKDNIIRTQLKAMVDEFGKSASAFKSADEALKAGFVPVKEKGISGKVIGYLNQTDKKFIDDLISPEFATIDNIARATGFDAVTSLFKRSVTGLFAPFHVRNYVSGLIQNYEVLGAKALSPANIAHGQRLAYKMARGLKFGADDTLELAGKTWNMNDVMKPFAKRFETSSQYISDIGDAISNVSVPGKMFSKESLQSTAKTLGLGQQAIPFRIARGIGNFIETQQKATAYITALKDGKSVKEALNLATRAGFDYRMLTPFESKVLRRLIPFYSFTRKNIELQLRTLGENPQRINNVIKLAENLSGGLSGEEKGMLPEYAQEQFATKFGENEEGLPEIAVGFGTPIEQISQLFSKNPVRRIAATLNPIFKLPLERAFNKDFFRDRNLKDVVEANEYEKAPDWIKSFLQAAEVKGKNKTTLKANPYRLQLLRSLPSARGATYLGAIFADTTDASKSLNAFTGIKPRQMDLETVQYFKDRDKQRELEDLLIRSGVLKRFEKTYVPKNN